MTDDFIEDAMDLIDKSGDLFLLVISRGAITKLFSNFGEEEIPMLEDWILHDYMNEFLVDQIKAINES